MTRSSFGLYGIWNSIQVSCQSRVKFKEKRYTVRIHERATRVTGLQVGSIKHKGGLTHLVYCQLQNNPLFSLLIALQKFQLLIYATSIELERNCVTKLGRVVQGSISGGRLHDVVNIKVCFLGIVSPGGENEKANREQQKYHNAMYVGGTKATKQLRGYG